MEKQRVTDAELYEKLHKIFIELCALEAETDLGDGSLKAVRKVVAGIQMALLARMDGDV